jgi:hypothetical protein
MPNGKRDWGTQAVHWLKSKDVSFWISLISAAIAVWTFYFVYLSGPRLRVQLPKSVGIAVPDEPDAGYTLLIPAIFYNAGPERSVVAITDVTASLTPIAESEPSPLKFYWYETDKWLSAEEYKKEYPEDYADDLAHDRHVEDYVVYDSRVYPFVLFGGGSATKLLKLWADNPGTQFIRPSSFDLSLTAMAGGKQFTTSGRYSIGKKLEKGIFNWFTQKN